MKRIRFMLIPTLLAVAIISISCSSKNENEEMREGRGRRQVLSDKKDVPETAPTPSCAPYIMRLENKTLTLYEISNGEENAVCAINIDPSYYPTEDIKELSAGIPAYSKEEGFARLENFTN